MPAQVLTFPTEAAPTRDRHSHREVDARRSGDGTHEPILLETLPGRDGERLCIYRYGGEDGPRLRLVWQRHARDIGWYRLRSLELSRDQAGRLQRLLDAVDLTPPRRSSETVTRLPVEPTR